MITRSPDDGRTHAGALRLAIAAAPNVVHTLRTCIIGILPKLLSALHSAGIITEDLSLSSDAADSTEASYRGLCVRPTKPDQDSQPRIRRRIDILAIPWEYRGAALLYFTGDDIFNRSMRLKANKMGYSLNQRGLFAGVVRSTEDRTVKTNTGTLLPIGSQFVPLAFLWVPPATAPQQYHERRSRAFW
ncbi:hypothetical protein BJV78DRAFT_369630 [Lactifluus subvellereus]|nr:hypothetical protein BJV78DRAFT_369630 [Lactifluus subvellereus]